ncbi:MAG: CotH kinase family protein [Bacteroidaceae bacterium]|nr:CotH kinase family protein [Bacteroidaceae bacterium]
MKRLIYFLLALIMFIVQPSMFSELKAQRNCGLWLNEVPLVADTTANSIYATIEPRVDCSLKGTLRWDESRFSGVTLNDTPLENGRRGNLELADWTANATNTLTITDGESKQWKLIFSTLPFIVIDCPLNEVRSNYSISKDNENHYRKFPGYMSVIDARCRTKLKDSQVEGMACFDTEIGIRLRGQTSGSYPKNSFSIELKKDGESNEAHLLGYRKDDDWILAAEYADYSRMRNRVLMDLWNSVDDLPYEKDNRYQGNGTQGEFVEVFMNGAYYGLCCFTDKIDRKKLNLKKTKEATETTPEVKRGMLWKAIWECSEAYLSSYKEWPTNDSFLWPYISSKKSYGWEQKYPDDTISQAFFDPLCYFMDYQNSKEFVANWRDKLYEDNVTDYILFIQIFRLMDNQKKNYYFSTRNWGKEQKFLFTLWDLDGSIGRAAGGGIIDTTDTKQMAWGEKLGYHHTIHVFKNKKLRPDGYATIMNNRWQYLKTHQLSLENIRAVMEKYATLFATSGAWEREKARWQSSYKNEIKIADTPQEEVEFMMNFLKINYTIFDEEMTKDSWAHDEYNEEEYINAKTPAALYVIGNDVASTHEDNTVLLPGSVQQEDAGSITNISYNDSLMTVVREDDEHQYRITDIKEVRTTHKDIYTTPAFIPDSLKHYFDFDTRYAPVNVKLSTFNSVPEPVEGQLSTFMVQRTIQVTFDGQEVHVNGNLEGVSVAVDSTAVSIATELEGVEILVSGRSEKGKITIDSKNPCMVAATEGGTMLCSITANCDLIINTPYALNFFNDEFDGKCICTSGDVTIEDGALYFMMTSSGTLTDASFLTNPELGARAVMANNININNGKVFIKTIGHHGAVGLAAIKKIFINGGDIYIATYDDPIKVGSAVTINGGFTFATSLTNDGLDSKGDLHVNGGTISTYSPEGAEAAYDVNHFYCDGGTVIGVGYKSERPTGSKSKQASFRLAKSKGVKRYVKIVDAEGNEVAIIETPAYPTLSVVYSSSLLQKDSTYTLLTGDTLDSLQELTIVTAE